MILPHGSLVLVADGTRMRILRNKGTGSHTDWELVEENSHAVPRARHLEADAPGRSFESASSARHAYPASDVRQEQMDAFGEEALQRLGQRLSGDAQAIVIAPPHLLGHMRKHCGAELKRHIVAEFAKDLTKHDIAEIGRFLRDERG